MFERDARRDIVLYVDDHFAPTRPRLRAAPVASVCTSLVVVGWLALVHLSSPAPRPSVASDVPPPMPVPPAVARAGLEGATPDVRANAPMSLDGASARRLIADPVLLPVRCSPLLGPQPSTPARIEELLDRPLREAATLIDRATGVTRTVRTPADYLATVALSLEPAGEADAAALARLRDIAIPLSLVKDARPSRWSLLGDLDLAVDNLDALPPTLGPLADEYDRARAAFLARRGRAWRIMWPDSLATMLSPHHVRIDNPAGASCQVKLLAWGDFDADGFEDLLVETSIRPALPAAEASAPAPARFVILTRRSAGATLEVVTP
jgi:hypothetical protein